MKIETKHLMLKLVEENDAKFILELRQNLNLNKYISSTKDSLENQIDWIRKYKHRESLGEEYYFRIDKKDGEQLGFVRIYNINNGKFTWGSWIIKESRPKYSAIESALAIYEFAFGELELGECEFDVRKENKNVIGFHEKFGVTKVKENNIDCHFILSKESYYEIRKKYMKFIKN